MSAVDTSIYDPLIRGAQTPAANPIDLLEKATQLKTAMGRAQMQPLELEQTRLENENLRQKAQTSHEDAADQKILQDLYGQVQTDQSIPPEKKLEQLRTLAAGKVKPRTLEALSKSIEDHQTALQKLDEDKLKQAKTVTDEIGNTAQGILSAAPEAQPALYAQERDRLIKAGVATPDHIPEQYDPKWLKMASGHAMGASNAIEAEQKRREQANKDADEARKAAAEEHATAAQTIDSVKDQDSFTAWRNKLSPAKQAVTAATFTPANVATIKRMGLTAEQQQRADDASATLAETKRRNDQLAADAAKKPTYSGEMRAALVAVGADPDKATPEQAAAALAKLRPSSTEKPATKAQLTAIEARKTKAIKDSKAKLDKEIATATVGGKVIDQDGIDQAWQDHIERLQDAQTGYENELTTATGGDVGHNDWADRLRVPGKAGAAPAQPGAPAAAGASAQAAGAPNAPGAAASGSQPAAPNPAAKALVSKYKVGQQVKLKSGQTVTIKSIDPETGNFEY